ncbi:hypothetical protein EVAR_76040_1 [Eumeta japonica]|uniref:Uncharacterized protein n=1 Tax=Eumeta variegata TaxID=151549 RepID=A0A4C1UBL5_EUMVA|nr:hypothetical protein EVAR_76040_1 [Eumeta japonica]
MSVKQEIYEKIVSYGTLSSLPTLPGKYRIYQQPPEVSSPSTCNDFLTCYMDPIQCSAICASHPESYPVFILDFFSGLSFDYDSGVAFISSADITYDYYSHSTLDYDVDPTLASNLDLHPSFALDC